MAVMFVGLMIILASLNVLLALGGIKAVIEDLARIEHLERLDRIEAAIERLEEKP